MHPTPVFYFEIPVSDLARAMAFYAAVFGLEFEQAEIHGNQMAFFALPGGTLGVNGALAQGEIYVPSHNGTLVYIPTDDIEANLALALAHGGRVLFPKTAAGEWDFVAELEDSEGNRIALHANT
jgi:predicted enzyme related to lactoylglutathione lyase